MHRLSFFLLTLLLIGCGADSRQATSNTKKPPTTQPTNKPTTHPTSMPVVRKWKPPILSQNEVNIIVMGDWGNDKDTQKKTAGNLAKYVEKTGRPFNAALFAGDEGGVEGATGFFDVFGEITSSLFLSVLVIA